VPLPRLLPLLLLPSLITAACAGMPWPDEPGVAVVLSRADNAQTGERFLAAITARRQEAHRPAPLVTQDLQADMAKVADDLQEGRLSATAARREARSWGRQAYRREVEAWVVDCAAGDDMAFPPELVARSVLVMSYAAARFRPRSAAADQCGVIVVAPVGAEPVRTQVM
jgi:hypothetical protein